MSALSTAVVGGPWPGELRAARDSDATDLTTLIGSCYAEYEGCVLDPDGVDAWMAAPASAYAGKGGEFWVLEGALGMGLVACVGWGPAADDAVELKNLYVGASARRQGLGARFVALVEDVATGRGSTAVELWSDTRFTDAHRLYERLGYVHTGVERELHDPSDTVEYGFLKRLPTTA